MRRDATRSTALHRPPRPLHQPNYSDRYPRIGQWRLDADLAVQRFIFCGPPGLLVRRCREGPVRHGLRRPVRGRSSDHRRCHRWCRCDDRVAQSSGQAPLLRWRNQAANSTVGRRIGKHLQAKLSLNLVGQLGDVAYRTGSAQTIEARRSSPASGPMSVIGTCR